MKTSVLLPMSREDGRPKRYQLKAQKVRDMLETKSYESIEVFLHDNMLDYPTYLNMIRSTLKKPSILYARKISHIMTNTFRPSIASTLKLD